MFVNYESIIERIIRESPPVKYNQSDLIEWTYDCLRILKINKQLLHTNITLEVENNRAILPFKYEKILKVCYNDVILKETKDINSSLYYYIGNGYIQTDVDNGTIDVELLTFPEDENGLPLIIDVQEVINAVVFFCVERLVKRLWIQDVISTDKYSHYQKERGYWCNAAQNWSKQIHSIGEEKYLETKVLNLLPSTVSVKLYKDSVAYKIKDLI